MRNIICLIILCADFRHEYLEWMILTERAGCVPVVLFDPPASLLDRIAPGVVLVIRAVPSVGAVRVAHCARSTGGAELAAYVEEEARHVPKLRTEFQPAYPFTLEAYPGVGLDIVLTGYRQQDTAFIQAAVIGVQKYLHAKGH